MKIKKGDKLVAINPSSRKKEKYIYLGKNKDMPEWYEKGLTRKVLDVRYGIECYVSDNWIEAYKVRKEE